ncbi:MAG: ammonium transporter [Pirellulaceae bacterium]
MSNAWSQDAADTATASETTTSAEPAEESPAAEPATSSAGESSSTSDADLAATAAAKDEDGNPQVSSHELFTINNLWICISAAFVFIMHLGFTTLEAGLTQKKNAVNIIFKNVWILCTGILIYAFWGFNAMYPGDNWAVADVFAIGSWFGGDLNDTSLTSAAYMPGYTWWGDFIFQAMFAATGATIVSGAVAERVKLPTFMLFSMLLVGFAYPISGGWKWGYGWLHDMGFHDFAGSSVVHAFGGFAALACVIILGPRTGKYTPEGIRPIVGHSMPLAATGVFLLWFGWYGFNGGSVLAADPKAVSYVFVTTTLGACGGAVASILTSWIVIKKLDVSMALNGILAGLVGITAGADVVDEFSAIIIGAVAGVLVVASILFFDRIKIDDPVGAVSVHGVCGVWGTLAVGLFSFVVDDKGEPSHNVLTQLIGTLSIGAFAFVFSFVVFYALKLVMGVRVTVEEEMEGLDLSEHGAQAYTG